jgi:Rps23 Pro-64 3,4-dihydroxylase Tpa1-like proline 4-hydroxylase
MSLINPKIYEPASRDRIRMEFETAKPYKHFIVDDFLFPAMADQMYATFPKEEIFNKKYKGLNEYKSEGSNFENFPKIFTQLREELNAPQFREFVSDVTGVKDVYSVDDALGAGLHQGSNGSFLDIHIDFNIHVDRNIHRRLNLLIFFNKDWKEEYQGGTEMWNQDMTVCEKKVLPIFNRCLMFETNEISYHGYSKISVPPGVTRKSFYTYYYTDLAPEDAARYHDTVFKSRPTDSAFKKAITPVKEKAKNFVKAQLKKLGFTFK